MEHEERKAVYRYFDEQRKQASRLRREKNAAIFCEASDMAEMNGLALRRCSDIHYQLSHTSGWLMNLFPGNQRVFADKYRRRAPYLNLPSPWTLIDAVRAAIKTEKKLSNA